MAKETEPTESAEPQVYKTQEDVDRAIENRLSRERKKIAEDMKSRPSREEVEELRAKLADLSELQELGGKSQFEKLQHQQSKAQEMFIKQRSDLEKQLSDYQNKLAQAEKTLSDERRNYVLSDALAKKGVFPAAAKKALQALVSDLTEAEFTDKGTLRLSYGKLTGEEPEKIAEAFLADNPYFAKAQAGGAGTKSSNGLSMPKNISDLSDDEILALVSQE